MKNEIAIAVSSVLVFAACATDPEKMQAVNVSPTIYRSLDCDQIAQELQRVTRRASQLQGSLKKKADDDSAQMAVGMILFWPALFFLEGGDGPEAAEYQHLKGERDALEQVAIGKKCSNTPKVMEVQTAPSENPANAGSEVAAAPAPTKEERLLEVKQLYEKGLISREMLEERQRKILDQ